MKLNKMVAAICLSSAVLTIPANAKTPTNDQNVKMTWFGITNWYYEIGDLGILMDGAVSRDFKKSEPELVEKVYKAMNKGAGVDMIFIGHEHGDHSADAVAWAKLTGAPIYTSKVACDAAIAKGVPKEQCNPVYGGEVIQASKNTQVRVVRWSHSFDCDATSEGGTKGIETFGFLFTTKTPNKTLSWFMTDSGAGGDELVTNRIVNGVDYGAPLANLSDAVRDAGLSGFDLWQAGPESRVVNQARVIAPVFDVKYFMPQHYGSRGTLTPQKMEYDIEGGLHYAYDIDQSPKLKAFMADRKVDIIPSENFFDAYTYGAQGVTPIANYQTKIALGLPAKGPGPRLQGDNPRGDSLECQSD